MSQSEVKKWVVRDAIGRISGPFTTEKILHQIKRSEFTGEEYVSIYPSGEWIQISKDPVFYDKLLEALVSEDNEAQEVEDVEEEQVTVPDYERPAEDKKPSQGRPISNKEDLLKELGLSEETSLGLPLDDDDEDDFEIQAHKKSSKKSKRRSSSSKDHDESLDVLELVSVKGQVLKQALKKSSGVVIVAILLVVGLSYFLSGETESQERVRLLAPELNGKPSKESSKGVVENGIKAFLGDSFEGYVSAQNQFVQALELNNKQPDIYALLCLTHLELWPFAFQDSKDMRVISTVVQNASALDPGGQSSATCRTVDLIVRGRYQEAKNLTEAMLETQVSQTRPPIVFYYLKGYLLEGAGEYAPAIGYFQSAAQLWPQWTKPFFHEAIALTKSDRPNEAANSFRNILKANPNHVKSKLELGLIEYKNLNLPDSGKRLIETALNSGRRLSTTMQSKGYLGLAEISLARGNSSQALSYAQKAYSLNSRNTIAENLVVQLGGTDRLKKTKVDGQQLMYEGDQFFREGDFNSAQAHYRAAYDENKKNAVAAMKAAKCFWKLSFSTEAFEWLNKAIRADANLIEAYVVMADYYTQRYNFIGASKILSKAQRTSPKNPDIYRGFALIELRRGNPDGAINFGKKSIQLYETNVETHILMSEAYLAKGDHRLAYNYAAKAIEIDINNRKGQTIYAEALGGIQGTDAAVDYLNKLVSSYPLVTEYRQALAKVLFEDERFDQAEKIYRQILKIEEKPKEALIGLAKIQKAEGKAKEALESLLEAAVMDPADAEPIFEAGLIYLGAGKPKMALTQFNRVARINKLYPRIHYEIGRAYFQLKDLNKVLEETRLEKGINPNLADAYLLAAEAYLGLQQYNLCASEYQQAIKLRPQSATIYVKMAQCYRRAGSLDAAMAMLTQAASQESGLADIYKEQGAIFETKGEVNQAIESYNQYFVLDPNAPDRPQIEQRIMALQRGSSN
ncbi:tetratricopeptide repeat protein [bacterium]|nr:tetratricopeptide repeat protein [bacterium]